MQLRQQSTAVHPLIFFMVDATTYLPKTGLLPTVKLGKDGATGVTASGGVSEIDATNQPGLYKVAANTTDSNTLGPLYLYATASGAMQPGGQPAEFQVVKFDPDTVAVGASTLTQSQVTGGAYALNSSSFAFNAALPFTTAQLAATLARVTYVDTTNTVNGGAIDDVNNTVSANVVSIVGDTMGATGLYSLSVDYRGGTLNCGLGGDVTGDIGGKVLGGGVSTITGIGAQVSGGGSGSGPTLSEIVDGVWLANIGDYLEPGQTGYALYRSSIMNALVWDEALAGHLGVGSAGLALSSAGSAGDPWNTSVPAAYPEGTAGYLFGRLTAPAGNGSLVPVPDATEPDQTNAYLTTFNGQGGLQGKVSIEFIMLAIPTSDSYTQAPFIRHSNTSGQLVTPLRKSTQYKAKRENGDYVTFITDSGSTYALPAILGL